MNKIKIEHFGLAGHFICGQWCRFHLCTVVGKYLVSTVGMMVHPSDSGASEKTEEDWLFKNPNGKQIGHDRYYETMVFKAGPKCSSPGCNCGQPMTVDGESLDFEGYHYPAPANAGHARMVEKWLQKQFVEEIEPNEPTPRKKSRQDRPGRTFTGDAGS